MFHVKPKARLKGQKLELWIIFYGLWISVVFPACFKTGKLLIKFKEKRGLMGLNAVNNYYFV